MCYHRFFTEKKIGEIFGILRSNIHVRHFSLQIAPLFHRKNLVLKVCAKIIYMFQNNPRSFITSMLKTGNVYRVDQKVITWCTPRASNCVFHGWYFL